MADMDTAEKLPHWDLDTIYPGLDSQPFHQAVSELATRLDDLDQFLAAHQITGSPPHAPATLNAEAAGATVEAYLQRMDAAMRLNATLRMYVWCILDTDSSNEAASRQLSALDPYFLRLKQQSSRFQAWLGRQSQLPEIIAGSETARAHSLWLLETAEQSRFLMSDAEESLAQELSLSGMNAWSKLHGTIWSQLEVPVERDGKIERLPMPVVQNLALNDPAAEVRQHAAQAEVAAWAGMREPLTAALNGVIGAKITLNKRRGRTDALQGALDQARIDRVVLDTLWDSIQDCLPIFHRFLKSKAVALGKDRLAWWDVLSPVGQAERRFTYREARAFITAAFDQFSPHLGDFARRAFERNWIDAEPRAGKQGGAYSAQVVGTGVSRILCNFDGSRDQVFAIAHELGHAFHTDCQTGKTFQQCLTPMTLAESASLFCECLATDRGLAEARSPQEEAAILNTFLGSTLLNVIWPLILYGFEKEVYERREKAELSADVLCEMVQRQQSSAYGDGVDPAHLHPYFWAGLPHLFLPGISFYNFPYPFGMLFSLGLYARYRQRGAAFVPEYEALLASTGEATPLELAGRFGMELRERSFWQAGLALIEGRILRFERLCLPSNTSPG